MKPNQLNVILGLNPCVQRKVNLASPRISIGSVNRASFVTSGVGGKGQGAFLAACLAALPSCTTTPSIAQFVGGVQGENLMMELCSKATILNQNFDRSLTVKTSSETRTCTTLISGEDATEIVEPGPQISPEEAAELLAKFQNSDFAGVGKLLVCGSLPGNLPSSYYKELVQICKPQLLLIDSVVGFSELMDLCSSQKTSTMSTPRRVILKLNSREIVKLAGLPQNLDGDSVSQTNPTEALKILKHKYACISEVLITDGPFNAAIMHTPQNGRPRILFLKLPENEEVDGFSVSSPIGAGDCVSGVLFQTLQPNDNFKTLTLRFAFALACGYASCNTDCNSQFSPTLAQKIYETIILQNKLDE